jgi:hypothetical protein
VSPVEAFAAFASPLIEFFFAVRPLGGLLMLAAYFVKLGLPLLAAELYDIIAFHLALALVIAVGVRRVCALGPGSFSLLYGVKPLDWVALAGTILRLFSCCALAGSWPARRAASIDPMRALRTE